jgi:hypothetical protein
MANLKVRAILQCCLAPVEMTQFSHEPMTAMH